MNSLPPLEALAELNLAAVARIHRQWQPAATVEEADGLLLMKGTVPIPAPFQNCLIRTSSALPPATVLERAKAFFGGSANPYAAMTSSLRDADLEHALLAEGFTRQADLPSMLADAPLATSALPAPWQLKVARDAADIQAFVKVCAQAYESLGLPGFLTPSYFVDQAAMLAPDTTIVLACNAKGEAVAATMALHTGEVAGLYWVGTLPEARGAGLAAACTALATNLAFERGAKAVTLQASHMGEAIYRKLGYREYARTSRWSK